MRIVDLQCEGTVFEDDTAAVTIIATGLTVDEAQKFAAAVRAPVLEVLRGIAGGGKNFHLAGTTMEETKQ